MNVMNGCVVKNGKLVELNLGNMCSGYDYELLRSKKVNILGKVLDFNEPEYLKAAC